MKKDLLIVFLAVLVIAVLIMGVDFQSVDEYYLTHLDDITPDSQTVTLSIRCDTVLQNLDRLEPQLRPYIPDDGVILASTVYVLRNGDSVFDLLYRAVRHNRIPFEYQGSEEGSFGSIYVEGIQYLYEFSCGPTSGWVYTVNGECPNYGCSGYFPEDGDVIEWVYTCDLGQDVGFAADGGETA